MWICTNTGFVSVVADENDPARLLVRARRKIDLRNVVGEADILEMPNTDYRYRTFIDREKFKQIVVAAIDAIQYPNFKNSVPDEYADLHEMYAEFWMMHWAYGDKDPATRGSGPANRSRHSVTEAGDLKRASAKLSHTRETGSGRKAELNMKTRHPIDWSKIDLDSMTPEERIKLKGEEHRQQGIDAVKAEKKKPIKWSEDFDLASVPPDILRAFWNHYQAGIGGGAAKFGFLGGREKELRGCPKGCGGSFGGRELRKHIPRCNGTPKTS